MVNVGGLLFSREIAGLRCLQSSLFKTDTFGTNISVCLIESQIEGVKKGRVRKKHEKMKGVVYLCKYATYWQETSMRA